MKPRIRALVVALSTALAASWVPALAWAHGEMEEPEEHGATGAAAGPDDHAAEELEIPTIDLLLPDAAELGGHVTVSARLTDPHDGSPIRGATVAFTAFATWGDELGGWMALGAATTDRSGTASLTTQVRSSGEVEIRAVFTGAGGFGPVTGSGHLDVEGDGQLYEPSVGIRVPWLNLWVLAGVIALVWGTYLLVGVRILRIARPMPAVAPGASESPEPVPGTSSRRSFLARALPLGGQAAIAAIGVGLVGLVARSPRTHGNLMAPPATIDYHRTPVARVGRSMEMRPMPEPLDRHVSFSSEILPIFLANGGPHVVQPEHSPPPGGLRLDSYDGVMVKEGVVVPGDPGRSELVEHLLSVGMQMPPSVPPLPEEQIQLIVTWIAQGARND